MKSEKRHEMQKNELADWLGNHAETAADYFWPVAGGIIVAFAAAIGIAWYLNNRDSSSAAAWDKYYQAFGEREREPELKKVAEDQPNTAAALWALQGYADLNASKGAGLMFADRAEAKSKLQEAADSYKQVLDKSRDPFLLARAQYGMARVQESLCQPEEAKKYYEFVAKSEKDSALGKAAARDAQRMADPQTVEFLDWFSKQTPKRPSPTGHGGIPGLPPLNVPSDLPARPDISLPGNLNLDSVAPPPAGATPGAAPGGLDFPKPDNAPKGDAPAEAPKGDAPKFNPPSADPPAEAPKADAPKADAPKPEEPKKSGE